MHHVRVYRLGRLEGGEEAPRRNPPIGVIETVGTSRGIILAGARCLPLDFQNEGELRIAGNLPLGLPEVQGVTTVVAEDVGAAEAKGAEMATAIVRCRVQRRKTGIDIDFNEN